jgi:hypothetical protein
MSQVRDGGQVLAQAVMELSTHWNHFDLRMMTNLSRDGIKHNHKILGSCCNQIVRAPVFDEIRKVWKQNAKRNPHHSIARRLRGCRLLGIMRGGTIGLVLGLVEVLWGCKCAVARKHESCSTNSAATDACEAAIFDVLGCCNKKQASISSYFPWGKYIQARTGFGARLICTHHSKWDDQQG